MIDTLLHSETAQPDPQIKAVEAEGGKENRDGASRQKHLLLGCLNPLVAIEINVSYFHAVSWTVRADTLKFLFPLFWPACSCLD